MVLFAVYYLIDQFRPVHKSFFLEFRKKCHADLCYILIGKKQMLKKDVLLKYRSFPYEGFQNAVQKF